MNRKCRLLSHTPRDKGLTGFSLFFLSPCLSLIFILTAFLISPEPLLAERPTDSTAELAALKAEFVKEMSQEDDPEEIMALAAFYAGRSWEIAVRQIAERYQTPEARNYIQRIDKGLYEPAVKKADSDPVRRQILGLDLMYRSVNAVAGIMALQRGDRLTLKQIQEIENRLNPSIDSNEDTMKAMVSLTKGIMTMLTLTLRSVDADHRFLRRINKELEFRVQEAEAIKARRDIHYYAKLLLWTVNNISGCFQFVYLLNLAVDERLAAEVGPIRRAWERHLSRDDSPIRAMALGLTAVAEASFPLATVLAER